MLEAIDDFDRRMCAYSVYIDIEVTLGPSRSEAFDVLVILEKGMLYSKTFNTTVDLMNWLAAHDTPEYVIDNARKL